MAADDLSTPLRRGGRGGKPGGDAGRVMRAINISVAGLIALGVGLTGWLVLRNDPLGGEPVVTIALHKPPPVDAGSAVEGGLDMRQSLGAERDEAAEAPADAGDGGDVKITIHGGIPVSGDPSGREAAVQPGIERTPTAASSSQTRLATAPDPGLIERSRIGLLPRIGADGRRPAQVYARPADPPKATGGATRARVAILITGLGISAKGTDEAIHRLPEPVSLAFAPYGNDLQTWVDKARQNGHEVLLQLPMEPFDYPDNDPGPHTMLTKASAADNLQRLQWLLARVTGYFALTNYMGAKFTASSEALTPVLDEVAKRGLAYVDDGSSPRSVAPALAGSLGLPALQGDVVIDASQTRESIDTALLRLEAVALERGQALGVGTALPVTIDSVNEWTERLRSRGLELVPVSALTGQPPRS